ncbi:MAG: helix-turn-helix domain-containing protein [Lachnospiraceae bacterium]|nr:helix-turn-helix domain-containing protein [Lachnospiraceae bacterium]
MTMNFARNFWALRKKNNVTQEVMAEKCGVSRAAVAKWENGSSLPNLYMVSDIAEIFGITVDELLHGEMETPEIVFDSNAIATINDKLDVILSEIMKRDKNTDAYTLYCQITQNSDEITVCDENIPIEAYKYWGNEEALKGNYEEALKYYEEAVIRGDVNSVFTVLSIYEDMVDMYAYDCNMSDILQTRLIEAGKMQQYGKIIEEVINRELKSGIHNV